MKRLVLSGLLGITYIQAIGQNIYMPHMMFRGPNDCHRPVYVIPKITSLDSKNDSLKIDFILFGVENDTMKLFSIAGISAWKGFNPKNVFAGDSLVLRITTDKSLDSISFPSKPIGFSNVVNKKDRPYAKVVDKNSDYTIYFNTPESCYQGEWHYDSRYGHEDYRWLFNSDKVYDPFLSASYENWSKKDYIEIYLKDRRVITDETFKVLDSNGIEVAFELVTKRNPTKTIALTLSRDLRPYEKFTLLVSDTIVQNKVTHETYFKYPMNVGSKGTVGLAGRYNFLEE